MINKENNDKKRPKSSTIAIAVTFLIALVAVLVSIYSSSVVVPKTALAQQVDKDTLEEVKKLVKSAQGGDENARSVLNIILPGISVDDLDDEDILEASILQIGGQIPEEFIEELQRLAEETDKINRRE